MIYQPDENRYHTMEYRRCGRSGGVKLPAISLGYGTTFGDATRVENSQRCCNAFDSGHYPLWISPIIMGRRAPQNAILPHSAGRFFNVAR